MQVIPIDLPALSKKVTDDGDRIFVVAGLKPHMLESLVQCVAEKCGLDDDLGKKFAAA